MHRRPAGLHLPTGELGTVIRKDQSEIAHDLFRVLSCLNIIVTVYKALLLPSRNVRRRVGYTIALTINFTDEQ